MYRGLLDPPAPYEPVMTGSTEITVISRVSVIPHTQTAVIRVLESVSVALVTAGSRAANHVRRQITETNAKNSVTA